MQAFPDLPALATEEHGNKLDLKGPGLPVNPLVKSAAHATAPVVKDLDFSNLLGKFHFRFVL
jgi:hypothetical protein